jgi:hypothetical protein
VSDLSLEKECRFLHSFFLGWLRLRYFWDFWKNNQDGVGKHEILHNGYEAMSQKKKNTNPNHQVRIARAVLLAAIVTSAVLVFINIKEPGSSDGASTTYSVPDGITRSALTDTQVAELGAYIQQAFDGNTPSADGIAPALSIGAAVVYANFREEGQSRFEGWRKGDNALEALQKVIELGVSRLKPDQKGKINTIELNFAHSFQTKDLSADKRVFSNIYRGIRGAEFIHDGRPTRYGPTKMLATNRSLKSLIEVYGKRKDLTERAVYGPNVRFRTFEADQVLVKLGEQPEAIRMIRGNRTVPIESVSFETVKKLSQAHIQWLKANLSEEGRMTYKYWPSRGEESTGNNMIRQWMATVCLDRVARAYNDTDLFARVAQNIKYNMSKFYREEGDGLGLIEFNKKVKLGAIALAALAIVEHPERATFAKYEKGILKTMDALWFEDGSFKTFYKSPHLEHKMNKHSNANFYPGEALLLWATLYEESRDPVLLDKIMKSFNFYKTWHLDNRNPAFIPWHTQAYYLVWKITQNEELRDFVFLMNDWLLGVQQWDTAKRYPDTQGRFYDPKRPFGPPHASSTGVYLEGLIDAHQMAKAVGDTERQEKYRRAIVRGLRSIMQLTFMDEVDLYYVHQKEKVMGGVRETVYDNEIRVDNIQHNLMGILKILRDFEPNEYRP